MTRGLTTAGIAGVAACVLVMLAAASPATAQGKSAQANGQAKKGSPPSRNALAPSAITTPATSGGTPFAWIDDATVLGADMLAVSTAAAVWKGAGSSEVDIPVVDAAYGLAPRLQLSMSVTRVVGSSDPTGAAGGIGTSFFSGKIAVLDDPRQPVKLAVTPTIQVLGHGVADAIGADRRTRWGLPVSAEIGGGPLRVYGGGGYFSPGVWFTGAAGNVRATPRLFVSGGISRAWRTDDGSGLPMSERDRKEISGGAAYVVTPLLSVFGSVGRTFATLDENGAGTSISGGVSLAFVTTGR